MRRFRMTTAEVRAVRVGADGRVAIDGRDLVGDAGTWLVVDWLGAVTTWVDVEFRRHFEPMDDDARDYLESSK